MARGAGGTVLLRKVGLNLVRTVMCSGLGDVTPAPLAGHLRGVTASFSGTHHLCNEIN